MSLYICVFASDDVDEELDGVEVGSYDDFHTFRATISRELENDMWGSRFPMLMLKRDSGDGWSTSEALALLEELAEIDAEARALPPVHWQAGSWQNAAARRLRPNPTCLSESLIDIDGEPLLVRMMAVARTAIASGRPLEMY